MEELAVSTVVYRPAPEVFDLLAAFPRYTRYTNYLREVVQHGDGGPGTRYDLHFSWWKLGYTARTEVTAVSRPERIEWRAVEDVDAEGSWLVESLPDLPADAPADAETACRVRFEVAFDPDSASPAGLDLPALVSLDWVIDRVRPLVVEEAERVVERVVADLEGRRRDVSLTVERSEGNA